MLLFSPQGNQWSLVQFFLDVVWEQVMFFFLRLLFLRWHLQAESFECCHKVVFVVIVVFVVFQGVKSSFFGVPGVGLPVLHRRPPGVFRLVLCCRRRFCLFWWFFLNGWGWGAIALGLVPLEREPPPPSAGRTCTPLLVPSPVVLVVAWPRCAPLAPSLLVPRPGRRRRLPQGAAVAL